MEKGFEVMSRLGNVIKVEPCKADESMHRSIQNRLRNGGVKITVRDRVDYVGFDENGEPIGTLYGMHLYKAAVRLREEQKNQCE